MDLDANFFKREFIAGGLAGAVGILIGFPFDSVKVKLQAYPDKYTSAMQCFRSSVKEEGMLGLFRGCIPPTAIQGFINSIMFLGDSATIRILEPDLKRGEKPGHLNSFIAGCAGGTLQCVVAVPAEVVKCTMQANTLHIGEKLSSAALGTAAATPTAAHESTSLKSSSGSSSRSSSKRAAVDSKSTCGVASAMSSKSEAGSRHYSTLTSRTVSVPAGAGRVLFSSSKAGLVVGGSSAFAQTAFSIKQIYQAHGLAGFYRGLGVTVIRDVPSIGLYFFTYKYVRDSLSRLGQLFRSDNDISGSCSSSSDNCCPSNSRGNRSRVQLSAAPESGTFISQPPASHQPPVVVTLVSGAIAGAVSWISVYPFDVIKTNMQISRGADADAAEATAGTAGRGSARRSTYAVATALYRQHGVKVFFRGLGTTVLRSVPVNSATFCIYEYCKDLLHIDQ